MNRMRTLIACLLFGLMTATFAAAAGKPKSVLHIITVNWKADATPDQIKAAVSAAENIKYPGVKNVWTRPIKMQLPEGYDTIIVMEFESEDALKKYADSPAQKEWYKVYLPVRGESRTHDVTN